MLDEDVQDFIFFVVVFALIFSCGSGSCALMLGSNISFSILGFISGAVLGALIGVVIWFSAEKSDESD